MCPSPDRGCSAVRLESRGGGTNFHGITFGLAFGPDVSYFSATSHGSDGKWLRRELPPAPGVAGEQLVPRPAGIH